jgi:quinol monooxygenase YgiN
MHVLIVDFHLKGIGQAEYERMCDELASAVRDMPGLIAKIWLADPSANTYGGVSTFRDRRAMEDYMRTDIFQAVINHPNLADVTSRDFGVLDGPTALTRGLPLARV